MKKIILSFALIAVTLNLSAQYNQEEMLKEMQKRQEEMMKNFENLEFNFGDSQLFIDTFFVKEFDQFGNSIPMEQFSGNLSELIEMLQQQMQNLDATDWAEMQRLFESFGDFSPMIPAPENLDEFKKEEGDIKEKSNKKRKSYTL